MTTALAIHDAHTHFFSRPFFLALAASSPAAEAPEALLAELGRATGLSLPDPDLGVHRKRWLDELDRHGVARAVTFASLPQEAEAVAAAAAESGGRLLPYALVNLAAPDAPAFAEKALGQLGFRGLLAFPALHHVRPSDERALAVYAVAASHRAPVLVHCGVLKVKLRDLLGLPRVADPAFARPLDLVAAANRFPELVFVLPHFGGGLLHEALLAGEQCSNIWVDTSSSNEWMRTHAPPLSLTDVFRSALAVFGAERILFGTDSGTFPRGWRADVKDSQLAALRAAGADEAQIAAILGGNLLRLLPPR